MPNILSPSYCLNNQNISPLPTHGHCHCGQFKIPVVSPCVSLGDVAMKNRVRLQAQTTNLRASFSKHGGLMQWRQKSARFSVPRARHFLNTGFCRGLGRKRLLVVNQEESCSNQRYFFLKKFIQICHDIRNTCRVQKFE